MSFASQVIQGLLGGGGLDFTNVGATIGRIPQQQKEQQQRKNDAAELARVRSNSPEYFRVLAKQANRDGDKVQAANYLLQATQIERDQIVRQREDEAYQEGIDTKAATKESYKEQLQAIIDNKGSTTKEKNRATLLLSTVNSSKTIIPENVVKQLDSFIQRTSALEDRISISDYANLTKTFTSESVAKFKKSKDVKDLSLRKPKQGSTAAPSYKTIYNEKKGINEVFALWRDDSGTIQKELIGQAEVEEDDADDTDPFDKKWASDLLADTREKARDAKINRLKYSDLAGEASDREWYERGFLGKKLSETEEALGIAGSATTHRRRINEIRMSGALALLPPGVASDRDVQLAMDATIDPNNLSNEEAEGYLRGMAIIAKVEEEYYSLKLEYMQDANDPNAVGFEDLVAKKSAEKDFNKIRNNAPDATAAFVEKIKQANNLTNEADRNAALTEIETTFPEVFKSFTNLQIATNRWDKTVSKNSNLQGIY
jgi:hypothetical protein